MANVDAVEVFDLTPIVTGWPERQDIYSQPTPPPDDGFSVIELGDILAGQTFDTNTNNKPQGGGTGSAELGEDFTQHDDWFEAFHIVPRRLDFGNILTPQSSTLDVYSAHRKDQKDWTGFTNNAGVGVTATNLPSLPETFDPETSFNLTIDVDTDGPPSVDSTFDFTFDDGEASSIPITLERIILFFLQPNIPYIETLEWGTDVIAHADGTEMRASYRKNPRQIFDWDCFIEEGRERGRVESLLFDWSTRVFGVPVWHELTKLTAAASSGATTITVESTNYADYRVGGLVVVYQDSLNFDVHTISAFTATTITIESPLGASYAVNTFVAPVRTAVLDRVPNYNRYIVGGSNVQLRFRVTDNDPDSSIADTSAFSSYNSKVLLDDCNGVSGTMQETNPRDVVVIGNTAGRTSQSSAWDNAKRTSQKTFLAFGKQAVWEHRQLLHALRGRQISFYIPTFSNDLIVDDALTSGANTMIVQNIGYSKFIQERQHRDVIRITFNNGDPALIRTITASSEIDSDQETLTLGDTWPDNYATSDVERVEFIEKSRFNSDTVRLDHELGERLVRITVPVQTVLE